MADLFLLSQAQMRRIRCIFRSRVAVDLRRIVSAIVFVIKNGLRRRDAPGDVRTRRSTIGSSAGAAWACSTRYSPNWRKGGKPERIMIDATHLKAHRTAASLLKKKGLFPYFIGCTKGGLNSKLHAVCEGEAARS